MTRAPRGALSLPDVIAMAFTLLVKNRLRFLLLAIPGAILSTAASFLLAYIFDRATGTKNSNGQITVGLGFYGAFLGGYMAFLLSAFITDALIVPAAIDALLGRRPNVRGSVIFLGHIALPLLIGWVLICGSVLLMLLSVIAIPFAILLAVRWSFFIQELYREPSSAPAAMRRSAAVVQGFWWRIFAIQIAIVLLSTIPNLVVQPIERSIHTNLLDVPLAFLALLLSIPFGAVARTVLYSDIKLRKGDQLQPATIER